ncbi:MAG: MBL fold metallo-hydrolase [Gammaproteobacteria bacterium]|jgi:glyoxylase-like metal-dependent hydrolase (beta-lactamase superfamily II)|nr:MBL fold metallo-hydrolase [Gammaproteobacteria bacterium]
MQVEAFFDDGRTFTLTYVVYDAASGDAVVIDPVLDLDTTPWRTFTESIDKVERFVADRRLKVHWILDTHVHADHLSGVHELKRRLRTRAAIGSNIAVVQEIFKGAFNLPQDFPTDGRQFDRLLRDGDVLEAGTLSIEVIHTPGHTPACSTYRIGDAVFTGDVLFIPDVGVARCDFPRGSARDLYRSVIERLYTLPDDTQVYVGHDYPNGRDMRYRTTIGESKRSNIDLPAGTTEDEFVRRTEARDRTLSAPRLLFPSLQVNINAGALPAAEGNGVGYLKIPLNYL